MYLLFIRNYFTKELVMHEEIYLFQRQSKEFKVTDRVWKNVRDQLVVSYTLVQEGDYLEINSLEGEK
ncbi:hypothetical protein BED47_17360 [Gottfriedia luciferensis]|uniref:Uncharacterized protein n=1 Tax=Gottfriedia luciferensis TaxID=178774 RepID=A0ABX2ZT54_9BACI|nr:hypothetical protein BED47_17360 [Gottfriedia luciferensis]